MKAMVLHTAGKPLELRDIPVPNPDKNQLQLKVQTCGVCRTDLHIVDGELEDPNLPLVLGHQIVGTVEKVGENITEFNNR
ncbi:MAG: alcohol dehydrogenase catalytic domain-containing protein [Fodinibius sp.]|nr:alcohol dehydrogenase catalytic domain-containing protein [Fodinibius sp.]MDZ7659554.1 alcohol dehydrogenase catalytic domain-containing protein [Fodinibius sp.]